MAPFVVSRCGSACLQHKKTPRTLKIRFVPFHPLDVAQRLEPRGNRVASCSPAGNDGSDFAGQAGANGLDRSRAHDDGDGADGGAPFKRGHGALENPPAAQGAEAATQTPRPRSRQRPVRTRDAPRHRRSTVDDPVGSLDLRRAKIMRPADVWSTLVTTTSKVSPMCRLPPSTTIMVPSSR